MPDSTGVWEKVGQKESHIEEGEVGDRERQPDFLPLSVGAKIVTSPAWARQEIV